MAFNIPIAFFNHAVVPPTPPEFLTYDSINYSVSAQENIPQCVEFSNDGTTMVITGLQNGQFQKYTLSIGFDLTTVSWNGNQGIAEANPTCIRYNNDGSKMYIQDNGGVLTEYNLTGSAYDVFSYSKAIIELDVSNEDSSPYGITMSPDGTKLYLLGESAKTIYQYTLSTPFDVSTGTYDSVFKTISAQDNNPVGIHMDTTGTKIYIVGGGNDTIFQYTLGTPFDLSTLTYDSKSFSVNSEDGSPQGIFLDSTGVKMFITGLVNSSVFQYTLGTPFDVSTASYDSKTFDTSTQDTSCTDLYLNTTGTKMFVLGAANNSVYQYTLSTPFDVSTTSYDSISILGSDTVLTSMYFNSTGERLHTVGLSRKSISSYSLSTGFDLSSAIKDEFVYDFSGITHDITFKNDGSRLIRVDGSNNLLEYTLTTPYSLDEVVYVTTESLSAEFTNLKAVCFNSDGTKLYAIGNGNNAIYRYTLPVPYQLTGITLDGLAADVSTEDTDPYDIVFGNSKIYMLGSQNDSIYQYTIIG